MLLYGFQGYLFAIGDDDTVTKDLKNLRGVPPSEMIFPHQLIRG